MKIIDLVTESYKLNIPEIKRWLENHIQSAVDDDDPVKHVEDNFSINNSTGYVSPRGGLHPVIIDVEEEELPVTFTGFRYLTIKHSDIKSLKNIVAANETISNLEIENCTIETLEGCPSVNYLDIDSCKDFKSTKGCPTGLKTLRLSELNLRVEDLMDLPPHLDKLSMIRLQEMKNLKDIQKFVKSCEYVRIAFANVESNILGLMKIKGLKELDATNFSNENAKNAFKIVTKNLDVSDGFTEAMDQLIEAGLKEFAKS